MRVCAVAALGALALAWPIPLHTEASTRLQRWVDATGVIHYSDRLPSGAGRTQAGEDSPRLAHKSIEEDDGLVLARARNLIAGPIEIELSMQDADNVSAWPPLPHRMVLEPLQQRTISALERTSPRQHDMRFALQLLAIPGDPAARRDDPVYAMPVRGGARLIAQGFGGEFSHTTAENFHAIDFAVAEGTPVLAAREGVVMKIIDDHSGGGTDQATWLGRANVVRILHDDGSMAVYAHLAPRGARVGLGERVRAGQHIADSGNTGFSSGPHLHFVVQLNRGMRLESVPIRLQDDDGRLVGIPGGAPGAGAGDGL